MKIVCHILNSILPSGAETMLNNSADDWDGYEKHIVATAKEIGEYAAALRGRGYIIHHIYADNFLIQHHYIRKLFRSVQPNVVHIHRESQDMLFALDARMTLSKCSLIRTVHSVFIFSGFERIKHIIYRFCGRVLGVKYISIGKSVHENEKNNFFNKPKRLIPNWYDKKRFGFIDEIMYRAERKKQNIDSDTFVMVSVGNCSDTKNHTLIITALAYLKKQIPDLKFLYLHVGSGEKINEEIQLSLDYGLEEYVDFVGQTAPDDYLKLADLFVMPSKYEGLGIACVEALACGIPALLTDVVGLRDFKELNLNEIYYTNAGQNDFSEKLLSLARKFQKGELKHSNIMAEKIAQIYDMHESVKAYMEVYEG